MIDRDLLYVLLVILALLAILWLLGVRISVN
jgi:hypothetical protein